MKYLLGGCLFFFLLVACNGDKRGKGATSDMLPMTSDSALNEIDTLSRIEEQAPPKLIEADELFEDFIFLYASDTLLQQKRVKFPLPYYKGDTPLKIEKEDWEHDCLFTKETFYTLLFDKEEEMDMVEDTTLTSVQVEWVYLDTRQVKRYYFERIKGMWMLEAINLRQMEGEDEENFVDFYARFAADSLFQLQHIHEPLRFVTLDPDDESQVLETTIEPEQWCAFRPILPTDKLSNICYGQKNEDTSHTKVLKLNGIGNGYSNVFYFRKRHGKWELYKYEDTSI